MIKDLIAGLVSPITDTINTRSENKTAIKLQKIERLVNAEDKLAAWESIKAAEGRHSWKDEYWTIVLSVPALGCFIPGGAEVMKSGFAALATMPDFYQYWLGAAVLTAFGIRTAKR